MNIRLIHALQSDDTSVLHHGMLCQLPSLSTTKITWSHIKVPSRSSDGHAVAYPGFHFGRTNLAKFQPVIAYDVSKKNVVMQV